MRELSNLPQAKTELDAGKVAMIILIVGQKRIHTAESCQMDYIVVLVVGWGDFGNVAVAIEKDVELPSLSRSSLVQMIALASEADGDLSRSQPFFRYLQRPQISYQNLGWATSLTSFCHGRLMCRVPLAVLLGGKSSSTQTQNSGALYLLLVVCWAGQTHERRATRHQREQEE